MLGLYENLGIAPYFDYAIGGHFWNPPTGRITDPDRSGSPLQSGGGLQLLRSEPYGPDRSDSSRGDLWLIEPVGPHDPIGRTNPESPLDLLHRSDRPILPYTGEPLYFRTGRLLEPDRSVHPYCLPSFAFNFPHIFMPHNIFLIFFRHSTFSEDSGDSSFAQIGGRMKSTQILEVVEALL